MRLLSTSSVDSDKQELEDMIPSSCDRVEDEMKRDMDLIRDLLLKIEEPNKPPSSQELLSDNMNEVERETISEHLLMLINAGVVSGTPLHTLLTNNWAELRLTMAGHDFLDSVRSPETWAETKNIAAGTGGFTIDLLKDLAKGLIKKQIETLTGIKI